MAIRTRIPDYEKRFQDEIDPFVVTSDRGLDKLTPDEEGIYSTKIGSVVTTDEDIREYSCKCGNLRGLFYEGQVCEECNSPVSVTVAADLSRLGWVDISPYKVLTPNAFALAKKVVGSKSDTLDKIVEFRAEIDVDGNFIKRDFNDLEGIGVTEFYTRFDEIMTKYGMKKKKMEDAKFLIQNKDKIFTNKIPLINTLLRPIYVSKEQNLVSFNKVNQIYTTIVTSVRMMKKNERDIDVVQSSLGRIQLSLQEYYNYIVDSKISGKTKLVRGEIFGTRMSFSARMVIGSLVDEDLTSFDHVEMSYKGFLELYYLELINMMLRGHAGEKFANMTVFQIENYLRIAKYKPTIDWTVYNLMDHLIKNHKFGLWCIVSRNPTLEIGSLQVLKIASVSKVAEEKILKVPLNILKPMNGDFDGDVLNVIPLKEKRVAEAYIKGFNIRNLIVDSSGSSYYRKDVGLVKEEAAALYSFTEPI